MTDKVSMRVEYGKALVELGKSNQDVVVLSADVSNSDHSYMFEEAFPDRFINVGIAEQALVDVAAGLAYSGKIPFANTFAFLFATRALEMVRTHLCYGKANVKLMAAYAGLSDSFDGPTHHSVTDLAVIRSMPNMTVVIPGDPVALNKLLPQVADWDGPVYFRLNRNEVPVLFDDSYNPKIGEAITLSNGKDLTILCNGMMVSRSLEAAKVLEKKGTDSKVMEVHTLKPLDRDEIIKAARETGALVTVEEHSVVGGLGGAVAEIITEEYPVPVKRVGIHDRFAETGPYDALLDKYGMSVDDIVTASLEALKMKSGK
jgi:transketolase